MNLPSSPQPIPPAGGQPAASTQLQLATHLYDNPQAALQSILDGYSYWTSKLTESSFALSLAVIGANWAVFGSVDKIRNNICAELSIAAVIASLVINLIGNGWLGRLLRQRIEYAEQDPTRWEKEFNENAGKSTPWPSTKTIDCWAGVFRVIRIFLPLIAGAFFLIALFAQPKAQRDKSHSASSASPTPAALSPPSPTSSIVGGPPSVGGQQKTSGETKADTEATPTPEPTEDTEENIEEMNDWRRPSPDDTLFAVTRVIPDPVYIQRHDLDSVAVAILRYGDDGPSVVARHDFGHRLIAKIEWSPDSKFLLFTTASSGGHSPWHAAAFLFCTADSSFRDVDAAIGSVVSPKFRFEPPDVAVMEVKKDEKSEEDVKVSLSKTMQRMPRAK